MNFVFYNLQKDVFESIIRNRNYTLETLQYQVNEYKEGDKSVLKRFKRFINLFIENKEAINKIRELEIIGSRSMGCFITKNFMQRANKATMLTKLHLKKLKHQT